MMKWHKLFGAKTSLSFVFTGPNSVHPEVIRHANHNGTSFKAVWWSISEKTHLGLKHHFPLYLQGQTQHTLRFSGMPITMVQVSKLYDDPFLRKYIWALKHYFPLYLQGPNSAHPEVFRHANHNGTSFKAVWWSISEKTHFSLKHHFPLYLEGPNSAHPEVFRHANCNGTSFKAVWWSISEKTHLGLKHHFPLYLEGQTQCTLRFSGMPITMVQVSKLYDGPFLRKHTLG